MRVRHSSPTWKSSTTTRRACSRMRRRSHRWVRGDWQILWWLFPFVPSRDGLRRNRLPLVSRWKILDNLRRSLMAPATVAVALCSAGPCCPATLSPGPRSVSPRWRCRSSCGCCISWAARHGSNPGVSFLRAAVEDLETDIARVSLQLAFLANQACEMLHAITVTLDPSRHHPAPAARVGDGRGERRPRRPSAAERVRERNDREPARGARRSGTCRDGPS